MKKFGVIFLVLVGVNSMAASYTAAVPGGEWSNPASWVGGVVPTSGGTGNSIVIPSGSTITITDDFITFNGTLTINGTLSLIGNTLWGELDMDAASSVVVGATGQITSSGSSAWAWLNGIVIGSNIFAYWPALGAGSNPQTGPVTIDEANGVMPVELLFFEAEVALQEVELTWATASEENFDYFALERSTDGQHFKEIAQIQGMGDSFTRQDYRFTDEFPMQGRAYYRLRSVDFDGYTEVFDYVMVEVKGVPADLQVYPNPVTNGAFSIKTNFEVNEGQVQIYNAMGGVEKSYLVNDWMITYSANGLKPGSYVITLTTADKVLTKRLLIN